MAANEMITQTKAINGPKFDFKTVQIRAVNGCKPYQEIGLNMTVNQVIDGLQMGINSPKKGGDW